MKFSTWNVNGIRARQAQVLDWLAAERPDVVCLQEVKASPDQVPEALRDLDGYWCGWHGEGGYSGVALLISRALSPSRPVRVTEAVGTPVSAKPSMKTPR